MKKKLLVLLLTFSMILMNFAPAYGAGDFTDSDNVTAVEIQVHMMLMRFLTWVMR